MTSQLPLDTLGKTIKTLVQKGDKAIAQSGDYFMAAGKHLIEARDRLKADPSAGTFRDYLHKHDLGHSRAYELISIAEGKTTIAAVRKRSADSKRAARASTQESCPGCPGQDASPFDGAPTAERFSDDAPGRIARFSYAHDAMTSDEKATAYGMLGLCPASALDDAQAKIRALETTIDSLRTPLRLAA